MNKTSGFRTIEFKKIKCNYSFDSGRYYSFCEFGKIKVCKIKYPAGTPMVDIHNSEDSGSICSYCNGIGLLEKVESKVE